MSGLEVTIEVASPGQTRFMLLLPYRTIWLSSSGQSFRATLEVTMKVSASDGTEVWAFSQSYPLDIPESRLKEVLAGDFKAEAVAALGPGSYTLSAVVVNANDKGKASLERKFEI
jgi:hypothetical protein